MKTTIINKTFWTSDDYIDMHLDSKFMYSYLLSCPDKGYLTVFKFNQHLAMLCTGMSKNSIEIGTAELEDKGYIEVYNGYVGLLKADSSSIAGQFGGKNKDKEIEALPVDIREHFGLDDESIISKSTVKKAVKKPGPPPETITDIIMKQPEAIRETLIDFVEDRKERKKAPTTRAVKGWISKLQEMYPDNPAMQSKCLQQSIDRGWMGLFEVKEDIKKESAFL